MKHIITITDKDITGSDKLSAAKPRIAVKAVLFDANDNIALCYMGKYDLHTLPGGGVENGEDLQTAVKREIWEETGCKCEIIGELGQISENRYEHNFTQERNYYIARVVGEKGELHLTDEEIAEDTAVVWLPIEQAVQIISEKEHDHYQRKFIQKRDIAALNEALLWIRLHDIPGYNSFVKIEPITKGWSEDKKYCVTAADGTKYLLRISTIERYEARKSLFTMLEQVAALDIPMCKPVEFGTCDDGVYSLQSWIDGEDLETVLPFLSETEQYVLGLNSGEIIRKMHSIPAPETQEEWEIRFNKKINRNIDLNKRCVEEGFAVDDLEHLLDFVQNNRHLLKNRPQSFQHGDYHVGNMMFEKGELKIIDFDRYDFGDPWEEFNRMTFNAAASPHFATGLLRGYFNGEPPQEFFKLQAFYIASTYLGGLSWARKFGESEIIFTKNQIADILCWFDNMNNPVPTWYLKDFYIQWIDGIPYKLKAPFDFSFLSKYGTVFKVYDDQDSGNICFGVKNNDKRYFIKFAGAPTERAGVGAQEAIANLQRTVPVYRDLAHPNLIKFIDAEEIGGGFAMIFEWVDAECMGRMYPQSRQRFMEMPLETKKQVFSDVLTFHAHAASCGYVAIDFYDGSILYDFENKRTVICDIDFYAKTPYTNGMGRLWGSTRFMSPEEFVKGAVIDEVTNVYAMGATAFALFSDYDRTFQNWPLSKAQYMVVKKTVNDDRNDRQQSIEQLITEWEAAK